MKVVPNPDVSQGISSGTPASTLTNKPKVPISVGSGIPKSGSGALPMSERLVQTATPEQVMSMQKAEEEKKKAERLQMTLPLNMLSAYVKQCWDEAVSAKQSNGITDLLQKCLRQRIGKYDPEVLAAIERTRGSKVFMRLTAIKCRALEALVNDVLIPAGEKPWSLDPTPNPELPRDTMSELIDVVTEEAKQLMLEEGIESVSEEQIIDRINELKQKVQRENYGRALQACKEMERYIEDELKEGNFYEELAKFIKDFATFPTAFMKGPIIKLQKTLAWQQDEDGEYRPIITKRYTRTYQRVSPFDIYPSPNAKSLQDGYLCEHVSMSRKQLYDMIGVPGWSEPAIRAVIMEYGMAGHSMMIPGESERKKLENKQSFFMSKQNEIEGCIFWGPINGRVLLDWGMSPKEITDVNKDYDCVCVLLGRWVVMARLNYHPLGRRPYYCASYDSSNDTIWGEGPPQLMRDTQRICNALARAIVNNAGVASGPQVELDYDRLAPGQDTTAIWPWRIWLTKESRQPHGKPAIQFFQPNMMVRQLLAVYEYFFDQASEQSGIPAYIYGNMKTSGAGNTASGLSMLLNAASKTIRDAIRHIDRNVIVPIIQEHWLNLMLYDPKAPKYGDVKVVARASEYLVVQEQLQLRRKEFLDQTNNPVDLSIMGKQGRAKILREQAKSLKLPHLEIIPDDATLAQQELAQQQQALLQQGAIPEEVAIAGPGQAPPPAPATLSPDGGIKGKEPGRLE